MPLITADLNAFAAAFGVPECDPGAAEFSLFGHGDDAPRTAGTMLCKLVVQAVATSGVVVISLLSNADITPAGTLYAVTIRSTSGDWIASGKCRVTDVLEVV